MKVIIPASFYVRGGVERVFLSLLQEFDQLLEQVIVVLPNEKAVETFKAALPQSSNIVYELSAWPPGSSGFRNLVWLHRCQRVAKGLRLSNLEAWIKQKIQVVKSDDRLRYLVDKYQVSHCLYMITNRVPFPKTLGIPVAMISHDLFWHFAPLTYPEDLVEQYDRSLHQWLQQADQVIAVSQKTRQDLLTIFPDFSDKVVTIPSASDRPSATQTNRETALAHLAAVGVPQDDKPTCFFPSSFSLYKDHLTLLQAGVQLFKNGHPLKFVLTGRDTDVLIQDATTLASQKQTQEYADYVAALTRLKTQHADIWDAMGYGLGYCDLAVVEAAYGACDCVVMPSRYEGFGLAIAEAVVRGIPVIAADLSVFREQVEIYRCEDRIRFFPPGDAAGLAACLQEFVENPIPRLAPAEAAARFDHWTWRQVATTYLEVLAAL